MNAFKIGDIVKYAGKKYYIYFISGDLCCISRKKNQNDPAAEVLGSVSMKKLEYWNKTIRDIEIGDIISPSKSGAWVTVIGICDEVVFVQNVSLQISMYSLAQMEANGGFVKEAPSETVTIDGKTYKKSEVEERLAELKTI